MATKRKPLTLDERKRQSIRRGLHKAQVVTTEELRARMLASLDAKLRKTTKAKKGSVAPVPVTIMPLPKHRLFVRFADGVQGIYDMTELLVRPVFRPLRDPRFFALVMLGETGMPVWPNEADHAPGTLHSLLCRASDERKFQRLRTKIKSGMHELAEGEGVPLDEVAAYKRFKAAEKLAIIDAGLAEIEAGLPGIPHDVVMKTLYAQIRKRFGKIGSSKRSETKAKGGRSQRVRSRQGPSTAHRRLMPQKVQRARVAETMTANHHRGDAPSKRPQK